MLEDIELAIRARNSLIYVKTSEEDRLLQDIERIADKLKYRVKVFNAAKDRDPLNFFESARDDENQSLFVMQDFHRFINGNGLSEIMHTRFLRNFASEWKNQKKNIIITAPQIKLPDDLREDFVVFEDELPLFGDILKTIETFLESAALRTTITPFLKEQIARSCLGLTITQVKKILAKTLLKNGRIDEKCIDIIIAEKKDIIQRSGILEFFHSSETIQHIGGLDNLKSWLKLRSKALSREAENYGLPTPKGLLIIGVQGTGKSLTAKAVSSLWHMPLLRFDIGKVFGSLVGQSEERVREAIRVAEAISPCILWIDELDKAFSSVQGPQGDSGTSARVFGTILTWLQEKTKPVFVVATANNVLSLPPELMRKGRFDEIFFVDIPNANERMEIFGIHLKAKGREVREYNLKTLTEKSSGFTGAEIEQAIIDAMYTAFEDDERDFTTEDIVRAIEATVPLSEFMKEDVEALRDWAKGRARKASEPPAVRQEKNDVDFKY